MCACLFSVSPKFVTDLRLCMCTRVLAYARAYVSVCVLRVCRHARVGLNILLFPSHLVSERHINLYPFHSFQCNLLKKFSSNSCVVTLVSYMETSTVHVLAMGLCRGGDLWEYVCKNGPCRVHDLREVIRNILGALASLHKVQFNDQRWLHSLTKVIPHLVSKDTETASPSEIRLTLPLVLRL